MNTVQLTRIIDKMVCKTNFLGVLPCDHIPKIQIKDLPVFFIANTDPSQRPGMHWIAIYVHRDGVSYFFDSFGNKPDSIRFPTAFQDFLKNNSSRILHSNRQVQDDFADTCGQHCVFFLYHVLKGYDYDDVMKMYYDDLFKNDKMVSLFVKKLKPAICGDKTFNCIQCVQSGQMFQSY